MNKRIVIQTLDGLRKIIGQVSVEENVTYLDHLDNCDLGGRVGTVALVKIAPKYVMYQEKE